MTNHLYTYGRSVYSWKKFWLTGFLAVVAVLGGIPLIRSAYGNSVSSDGIDSPVWVFLVLALFVDAILAHEVRRVWRKFRLDRHPLVADQGVYPPHLSREGQ